MAANHKVLLHMLDCRTVVVATLGLPRMTRSNVDVILRSVELPFGSGKRIAQGRGKASWRSKNLVR